MDGKKDQNQEKMYKTLVEPKDTPHCLEFEPEGRLNFKGPFNKPSKALVKLTNPACDKRIAFKVQEGYKKNVMESDSSFMLLFSGEDLGSGAQVEIQHRPWHH